MPSSTLGLPGGGELRIEQEVISVNYLSDMDRNWRWATAGRLLHVWTYPVPAVAWLS